jgi:hypothetical protein
MIIRAKALGVALPLLEAVLGLGEARRQVAVPGGSSTEISPA